MNCATCGRDSGTLRECHDCWEIESRLTTYLRTEKGRYFVLQKLRESGALPPVQLRTPDGSPMGPTCQIGVVGPTSVVWEDKGSRGHK